LPLQIKKIGRATFQVASPDAVLACFFHEKGGAKAAFTRIWIRAALEVANNRELWRLLPDSAT